MSPEHADSADRWNGREVGFTMYGIKYTGYTAYMNPVKGLFGYIYRYNPALCLTVYRYEQCTAGNAIAGGDGG